MFVLFLTAAISCCPSVSLVADQFERRITTNRLAVSLGVLSQIIK
jgi:hypothetical protein